MNLIFKLCSFLLVLYCLMELNLKSMQKKFLMASCMGKGKEDQWNSSISEREQIIFTLLKVEVENENQLGEH